MDTSHFLTAFFPVTYLNKFHTDCVFMGLLKCLVRLESHIIKIKRFLAAEPILISHLNRKVFWLLFASPFHPPFASLWWQKWQGKAWLTGTYAHSENTLSFLQTLTLFIQVGTCCTSTFPFSILFLPALNFVLPNPTHRPSETN